LAGALEKVVGKALEVVGADLRQALLIGDRGKVKVDVYPAGEVAIAGADSRSLTRSIRQRGQVEPIFAERIEDVPELLSTLVIDGDVVVTQGAGNVSRLAQDLSTMYVKQGTLL